VIAFHAAFQSNNIVASSTVAAMAILVSTGLIGRFMVALVPQREGRIVDLAELEQQVRGLKGQVMAQLAGAREAMNLEAIMEPVLRGVPTGGFAALALAVPQQMIGHPIRLRQIRSQFPGETQYRDFARSVTALTRLRIQITFYGALRRYLSVWRVLHVGISLFLVLTIAAHIALSMYMGFIPRPVPH
jgi:hypothetical protein